MCIRDSIKFTLVIKDPLGNSAIVAMDERKIKRRKMTRREMEKVGPINKPRCPVADGLIAAAVIPKDFSHSVPYQ